MINPKSLNNLKPPVKGEIRNPAGKPKGIPNAATRYLRILKLIETVKNPVTGELEKFTVAEIMDRLEGRAKQAVDVTSGGESLNKVHEMTDNELNDRLRAIADVTVRSQDAIAGTGQTPSQN